MNDQTRWDLDHLKEQHAQLQQNLAALAEKLKLIESCLEKQEPPAGAQESPTLNMAAAPKVEIPKPAPAVPPPLPPVIRQQAPVESVAAPQPTPQPPAQPAPEPPKPQVEEPKFIKCLCQHCGGHLEFAAALVGDTLPCPHCGKITFLAMETKPAATPPASQAPERRTPIRQVPLAENHADSEIGAPSVQSLGQRQPADSEIGVPTGPPEGGTPNPLPLPPRIAEPSGAYAPPPASRDPAPEQEHSFEMRLGTYWLVRIGIVMILTASVLFANLAYQKFIIKMGPAGKVSLLYLASAALLGAGTWWQRKAARESLRNYAQVLFAGGLAAVYFTTYAAHHVENLRVIVSPLLDGALLLAWAGFMVWIADRKKSEVLALFAIGLAYYTSVITHVGSFTLYSNLVLTLAAVFFFVRNRWAALSFASLVATYVSYGFWRFFDGSQWQWATPEQGLWAGTYFLAAYWIVFTAAVFLSKSEKFAGVNRATFLTLNNGQFFVMFLLTMFQVRSGRFWEFLLGYGSVLLVLAELSRRLLAAEPLARNSYLTQGLLLVTCGFITKFAGLQLALLLGAESVVLLTLGMARKSHVLQFGAHLTGAMAVGWGMNGIDQNDPRGLYLGAALGALMTFNAFWSQRKTVEDNQYPVRPVPAFFTVLALLIWLFTTWRNTSAATFPLALAVETVALTLSIYALRMREIVLLGQGFLLLGQFAWLIRFTQPDAPPPWWNPALMIAITLGLSHWWQRQTVLVIERPVRSFWQGFYALAIIGVVYFWLNPLVSAPAWLVVSSLLAAGITAYGVFTRAWLLAACGQLFLLAGIGQFAWQLVQDKPEWPFPLAPIAALIALSAATVDWFRRNPDSGEKVRDPLLQLALIYRWVALGMSLWWMCEYIPARERTWVLTLLGALGFAWAGWRKNAEALLFSAAFTVFGFGLFWLPLQPASTVYLPNLLAILALLAQQRVAKRLPERYPLDRRILGAMIFLGGLSLWLLLTRWVRLSAGGFYLTASWSALALALFTCGIALRERVYRWLGLGVLACALGRVFLFDVWKLETLYRILSFMALGLVLLVLGFIYNKYQDKIKEWL